MHLSTQYCAGTLKFVYFSLNIHLFGANHTLAAGAVGVSLERASYTPWSESVQDDQDLVEGCNRRWLQIVVRMDA